MYPGKKLWLTETGYHNAINTNWGVSENAAAKYLPRALMWYLYYCGIERVFTYELVDEMPDPGRTNPELNFGLIRNDGTPKPVFTAWKNVMTLLKDRDTSFAPGSLDYTLSGDTAKVYRVLFQKKTGEFILAVWQEARNWDITNKVEIVVPRRALTLTLTKAASSVKVYEPCDPATLSIAPTNTYTNTSSITLLVPDHVMLVSVSAPTTSIQNKPQPILQVGHRKPKTALDLSQKNGPIFSSSGRLIQSMPAVYGSAQKSHENKKNGIYIIR